MASARGNLERVFLEEQEERLVFLTVEMRFLTQGFFLLFGVLSALPRGLLLRLW